MATCLRHNNPRVASTWHHYALVNHLRKGNLLSETRNMLFQTRDMLSHTDS